MKTKLHTVSFIAAIVTMLIGILVIIAWFMHNDFLRMLGPGQAKMKFNTALCFTFSSIVLLINYYHIEKKTQRQITVILSVIIILIASLTLIEYIFGLNLGIDELFVKDELRTSTTYYSGRMSPLSAINFILIGSGLLLLNKERTAIYQFYYLSGIAFIALIMLIGFNFIADIPIFIRLTISVAVGFITLAVAIWFAQPGLQKKISFERKLFTGFVAVIMLIAVLSIFSSYYSNKRISTAQWVEHTNDVLSEAQQILSITKDIESEGRGYIITGDSAYLGYFPISKEGVFNHIKALKDLTKDNSSQQERIEALSILINKRIDFSQQGIQLRNEKGFDAAQKLMMTRLGKIYTDKIRAITAEIEQEENSLLVRRQEENNKSIVSFNRAFFVFLTAVFVLLVIILFSVRNNITVRKKAEEELRESEEQVQTIFDAAPDAVIVINDSGKIVKWNPKAEILFGWKENEVKEKLLSETIIPDRFRAIHSKGLENFLRTGEGPLLGRIIETCAITKDNTELDVALNIAATPKIKGRYLFVGFVRDITGQKRAEKKFEGLLEAAPDAMVIVNEKGKIVLINKQTEILFGYARYELIGKPVELLIPHDFHSRHRGHRDKYFMDPRVRSMGAGLELFAVRRDGMQFPVEISLSPLQTEEGLLVSASVRDITDRKKAEEKFRSLLDAAPDATVIVNEKGIIQMINRQTENLFGYIRNEMIGQSVELLIPTDLRNKHEHHRESFFRAPKVRTMGAGIELNAVKKSGIKFPVEISLSPIQTEEGLLVSASVRDISLRKGLEIELRKTNAELEAFTYSVSHDLRAPLRGIIGFTAILEEEYASKLDDEARRITSVIKNNTLKMGHLVDDLLAFSRMGKQELMKTDIDTKEMVNEIVNELTQEGNKIGWNILTLPFVQADANTIRQVWINLISNAIKYSSTKEESRIEIGSYPQDGHIVFYVKDNGVGFDEEYKHKLFKVFQRLHDAEEFEGTGVGLAIVEKIVSRHGGKAWAEGKENEGACFSFSLPKNKNKL